MIENINGVNKVTNSPKDSIFLPINAKEFINSIAGPESNHITQTQFKQTFDGFFAEPQSMKELSIKYGIDRANVCRYCRTMRLANLIAVFKKGYCRITKRFVNKYTTNPDLFPNHSPQLKMF